MGKKESLCPICQKENTDIIDYKNNIIIIKCDRCKEFKADGKLVYDHSHEDWWEKRHIISAIIRELNIQSLKIPIIDIDKIEELLVTYPIPINPKEQADRLLILLSKINTESGKRFILENNNDYPLCYGKSGNELLYFLKYLINKEYLEKFEGIGVRGPRMEVGGYGPEYEITIRGWEYLNEIREGIYSNQAFVAMWFDDSMDDIYLNGIKPVLDNLGFKTINMKFLDHNGKIDDRIIAEIRKSRLLIADVTGRRHSVLYEAGFAYGLNLPVIWTCKESYFRYIKQIFDTRQYNHIVWKDIKNFKEQLKNRIEATIPNLPK